MSKEHPSYRSHLSTAAVMAEIASRLGARVKVHLRTHHRRTHLSLLAFARLAAVLIGLRGGKIMRRERVERDEEMEALPHNQVGS